MNKGKNLSIEPQDDLESLALEVSKLRDTLREVSQQILRIDRRLRIALPSNEKSLLHAPREPLDTKSVQAVITRLKKSARDGEQIEDELRRMNVKNELSLLARELGMTNRKLPPKHDLVRRIANQIRQHVSVEIGIQEGLKANRDITAS